MGIVHLHDVGVGGSGITVFRLKCEIPLWVLGGDKLKFTTRRLTPRSCQAPLTHFDSPIRRRRGRS